jgi:hypothetical protein
MVDTLYALSLHDSMTGLTVEALAELPESAVSAFLHRTHQRLESSHSGSPKRSVYYLWMRETFGPRGVDGIQP